MFESLLADKDEPSQASWLYQREGQVYGPVSSKEVLELLYDGSLSFESLIAPESGDFKPARRYGLFRAHQDKVKAHRDQITEATRRIREENRRVRMRRLGWVALALVLICGGGFGLRAFIVYQREAAAEAEAQRQEAQLQQEIENLLASVTIEPPLRPLIEEQAPAREKAQTREPSRSSRRRRRRPSARQTAEAASAGAQGELSEIEIMQGVGRVLPGFKRCIVEQIQRDERSVGNEIVVSFSVDNSGRAQAVSLRDRFLRRSPLKGCLAGQLAKVKWRAFKGEVRNIEYPIRIGRT